MTTTENLGNILSPSGEVEKDVLNRAKDLVKEIVSSKCGICLETLISPVFLPCGHYFCSDCLHQQIKETRIEAAGKCSVCRFQFGSVHYIEGSRERLIENLRPQKEISLLISLLGGPEYQSRIKHLERMKHLAPIIDKYCESERAGQIQEFIGNRFQNMESICISELESCLNCPVEELYYHLLIYADWLSSNKSNFHQWGKRYLFFRNHLIDTRNLGPLTPVLVIDTQITGLTIEEKYYLSLLAAGKSHWDFHCQSSTCEGVKMIHVHMNKIEKDARDKTGNGFQPKWIVEYRQHESAPWMEGFYQLLEKLEAEEKEIMAGKAVEKEQKKKKKKALLKQIRGEDLDTKDDTDKNEKSFLPWKLMTGFDEDPNLIIQISAPTEMTEASKKGLSCSTCDNYPCHCDHCDICGEKLLVCRCPQAREIPRGIELEDEDEEDYDYNYDYDEDSDV